MWGRFTTNKAAVLGWMVGSSSAIVRDLISDHSFNWIAASVSNGAVIVIALLMFSRQRVAFPRGVVFCGVRAPASLKEASVRSECEGICNAVQRRSKTATLVCGPSGAGKSTLLRLQVVPELKQRDWSSEWSMVELKDCQNLGSTILSSFHGTSSPAISAERLLQVDFAPESLAKLKKIIVVFDQAEQLLTRSSQDIEWMTQFLARCWKSPNVRLLMCIRSDYYLNLRRLLGEVVPDPDEVCWLSGLPFHGTELAWMEEQLGKVASGTLVREILGDLGTTEIVRSGSDDRPEVDVRKTILPLVLQLVGCV